MKPSSRSSKGLIVALILAVGSGGAIGGARAATTVRTTPPGERSAIGLLSSAPPLSGSFAVTETPYNYRAARSRPVWRFTPLCPSAGCGLDLVSSQGLTLGMVRQSDGLYHGSIEANAMETATPCTVPRHHLFTVHHAYTLREDVYVRIRRREGALVTEISGSLIAHYTPTAAARRQGCVFGERAVERFVGRS